MKFMPPALHSVCRSLKRCHDLVNSSQSFHTDWAGRNADAVRSVRLLGVIAVALVLAALGLELGLAAFGLKGVGWILLWPSVAFLIVAFAYLTHSPMHFGKAGPEFRATRRVLLFPYLGVVALLWHVMRIFEGRKPWNHLTRTS